MQYLNNIDLTKNKELKLFGLKMKDCNTLILDQVKKLKDTLIIDLEDNLGRICYDRFDLVIKGKDNIDYYIDYISLINLQESENIYDAVMNRGITLYYISKEKTDYRITHKSN